MHTLQRLFLSSDYQCQLLLEVLEHRYAEGAIGEQLGAVVQRFAAAVRLHQSLAQDPGYRQAREQVQRLGEQLRRDVERGQQRDRELAQLRREVTEIWRLRTRVAELESLLDAVTGNPTHDTDQHHQAPMSRQQRRAAQRAADKTH
ncbi:MAG: septation ring formation regulator EzrA [Mycobacterium sp.]|nr:MAG: septation ring formation regulator EzrA [Mycobacterium sp.]